ncbi:MAG: hypothetical protein PHN19_00820 [Patescibacteria group bacterium]|nr:hypothetical protein [Patescibacteria group bacterium]
MQDNKQSGIYSFVYVVLINLIAFFCFVIYFFLNSSNVFVNDIGIADYTFPLGGKKIISQTVESNYNKKLSSMSVLTSDLNSIDNNQSVKIDVKDKNNNSIFTESKKISELKFSSNVLEIDFNNIYINAKETYTLQFSMPDTLTKSGIRFLSLKNNLTNKHATDSIGEKSFGLIRVVVFDSDNIYLYIFIFSIISIVFFSCFINKYYLWVILIPSILFSCCLSHAFWVKDVANFWLEYWPDQYVNFAYYFLSFFENHSSNTSALIEFMQNFRNGHAWFVPLSIALFCYLFKISLVHSYWLTSLLFSLGAIYISYLLFRNYITNNKKILLLYLLTIIFSLPFARTFLRPITDGAGIFFVVFILYFTLKVFNSKSSLINILVLILGSIFGFFSRLALCPLLFLPIIISVFCLLKGKLRDQFLNKKAIQFFIIFLIELLLFLLINFFLGTFNTYSLAIAFGHTPDFLAGFSYTNTLINILMICNIFVIFTFLGIKNLFWDKTFFIFLICSSSIIFMLFFGKVISWPRHIFPVFIPILFLGSYSIFKIMGIKKLQLFLYCGLFINLFFLASFVIASYAF